MQKGTAAHILWSIPVTLLAAVALLFDLMYWLITLLFFGNFSFGSLWHLFVLAYTISVPLLAVGGYVFFMLRPSRKSLIVSLILSSAALAIHFLWTSELSRGLIH
jgi:hypothetical protein